MRYLAIFWMLVAAILTSCQPKVVGTGPWVQKIDSEELSRIMINFGLKMKIDKHLELEDSWASYEDYINRICLQFTSQRLLTLYDARQLLVELVEDLLNRLNSNSITGFQLAQYPFTARDLDVKISFESFYGRYVDELYIGLVWLQAGCAHYYAFDRKDPSLNGIDWDHYRFEPYSKSRELALIKKEVDLPYIDHIEDPDPPRKGHIANFPERYIANPG